MSYLPLRFVGLDNYADILGDEDLWVRMQTTAQFVVCDRGAAGGSSASASRC